MEIIANARSVQGTGASRRLRRDGKTPGVVYGGDTAPQAIELDHNNLYHALRNEAFHASILSLVLDGKAEPVLLRDVQMHPYRQLVLHVDFLRVDVNQKIHVKVPLHFVNEESAPGVKLGGGRFQRLVTDAEVSCLPGKLPEFVEVDCGAMQAGQTLHLSDIKLADGVEFVALQKGEDLAVASIPAPRGGGAD